MSVISYILILLKKRKISEMVKESVKTTEVRLCPAVYCFTIPPGTTSWSRKLVQTVQQGIKMGHQLVLLESNTSWSTASNRVVFLIPAIRDGVLIKF